MTSISKSWYNRGFFHIMVQGLNKEYIFDKHYYKEKYINLIKKYKEKYEILLIAYCVMGNHAHLLIYTENTNDLSMFMQNVNSKFAIYYNKYIGRVGYVFRGRFNWQYINNEVYLLRCLRYIHMNPVKANMVEKEEDYSYSTYNDYLNKTGIVNDIVISKMFGSVEGYIEKFLNISDKEIEIMDIDRENVNLKIAIDEFLQNNNIKMDIIKTDKQMLEKLCIETILNKKYRQARVSELLGISKSKISKIINEFKIKNGEIAPSEKFKSD